MMRLAFLAAACLLAVTLIPDSMAHGAADVEPHAGAATPQTLTASEGHDGRDAADASGEGRAETGAAAHDEPHPELSPNPDWAGVMLILILGLFVAAAVIGPVVRANMPEEVPPAHSHDEPPGTSHHHGRSGQLNPEPDYDEHGHGASGHH